MATKNIKNPQDVRAKILANRAKKSKVKDTESTHAKIVAKRQEKQPKPNQPVDKKTKAIALQKKKTDAAIKAKEKAQKRREKRADDKQKRLEKRLPAAEPDTEQEE